MQGKSLSEFIDSLYINPEMEIEYSNKKFLISGHEFDSHDQACWFNSEQEKAYKEIMLDLITQLISRLNEINDGSFVIEDLETERLKQL